jgi:hypothetical protein
LDNDPDGTTISGEVANPAWEAFHPASTSAPKAITYIRRGIWHLSAHLCPDIAQHTNIVPVKVSYGGETFVIINVYNEGNGCKAAALDLLMLADLDVRTPMVIAGDFNLHYNAWALEPRGNDSSAAELIDWTSDNLLDLANPLGVATRRGHGNNRDSLIDLVFFNISANVDGSFADLAVEQDLFFESDHNALTWTLNTKSDAPPEPEDVSLGYVIDIALRPEWTTALEDELSQTEVFLLESVTDIDCEVDSVMDAMSAATARIMKHRCPRSPRTTLWCTAECADTVQAVRTSNDADLSYHQRRLRTTVRQAKRTWADDILSNCEPGDIWNLVSWAKGRRRKKTPPIKSPNGSTASTPDEQCAAFALTFFLSAPPHVDAIQPDDPPPLAQRHVHAITREEFDSVINDTCNTSAPGVSGTNYRLVKWSMPVMGDSLLRL